MGPTESKFQEQTGKLNALAARIASMEGASTAFQNETQKHITQLDTNMRQQAHDTQNRLHSIGLRFEEHQKEVAQQLLASSQSLKASLVKTMRNENQAIHGTLAALQEMFQENLGRKKPKESNERWGRTAINSLWMFCGYFPTSSSVVECFLRYAHGWRASARLSCSGVFLGMELDLEKL